MLRALQVSLLLEVALVLDCKRFPGFRVAFDPSEINWDLDPTMITQKANNSAPQGKQTRGCLRKKCTGRLYLRGDFLCSGIPFCVDKTIEEFLNLVMSSWRYEVGREFEYTTRKKSCWTRN